MNIFKKEGAESYAHINGIVSYLRKYKAKEEKKQARLLLIEQEKKRAED